MLTCFVAHFAKDLRMYAKAAEKSAGREDATPRTTSFSGKSRGHRVRRRIRSLDKEGSPSVRLKNNFRPTRRRGGRRSTGDRNQAGHSCDLYV